MKPPKYNFRRQENKEKAVYKLVMYPKIGFGFKGTYTNSSGNKVMVLYGYYNKPDHGLDMLRKLIHRHKGKINLAIIYAKPNLNPNQNDFSEIVEKFTT